MIAFQEIRSEMRESCGALTRPVASLGAQPARLLRDAKDEPDDISGHIEPWAAAAFDGLIRANETGEPFALVPCFMNGRPAAVIALARQIGSRTHVLPLFVACQPWMSFGSEAESGESGPDRTPAERPAPR